jgi:hypothetical protein
MQAVNTQCKRYLHEQSASNIPGELEVLFQERNSTLTGTPVFGSAQSQTASDMESFSVRVLFHRHRMGQLGTHGRPLRSWTRKWSRLPYDGGISPCGKCHYSRGSRQCCDAWRSEASITRNGGKRIAKFVVLVMQQRFARGVVACRCRARMQPETPTGVMTVTPSVGCRQSYQHQKSPAQLHDHSSRVLGDQGQGAALVRILRRPTESLPQHAGALA